MTTIVVALESFTPLPRQDGLPWTRVRIEEAPAVIGPWTVLEVQPLVNPLPANDDPAHPATRDFSTTLAVQPSGWYRLTWIDAANHETVPTPPVHNDFGEQQGLRPSISEVAALLRARTKVPGGTELGTFGSKTRPTAEQADELVDEAIDEVVGKIGTPDVGSGLEKRARAAVKLYAACLIELSFYPEQIKTDRSAYASYFALYKLRIDALIVEQRTGDPGGDPGGDGGTTPADAAWFYPDDAGGLVGWSTRWIYDAPDSERWRWRCL